VKKKKQQSISHFPHNGNIHVRRQLNAYLVDDEPLAIERLKRLLANAGGISIAGKLHRIRQEALDFLNGEIRKNIDVVFSLFKLPALTL